MRGGRAGVPFSFMDSETSPVGYLHSVKQSHVAPMVAQILVHSHPVQCSSLPHTQLRYCSGYWTDWKGIIGRTYWFQYKVSEDAHFRNATTFLARVITQVHTAAKQVSLTPVLVNTKGPEHHQVCTSFMLYRRGCHLSHPLQNSLGLSVFQTPSLIGDWRTGLCPKTVPHAFLCMWTWQSSANHQQDVSFAFPMWWAIPTFTHFPCKNRTSPWLVKIRDVAVAKEKFSSVEVNPQGSLNPQSRASSTVFWGQSP